MHYDMLLIWFPYFRTIIVALKKENSASVVPIMKISKFLLQPRKYSFTLVSQNKSKVQSWTCFYLIILLHNLSTNVTDLLFVEGIEDKY